MLLGFLTITIMFLVAYAYLRQGVFTACTMCINVVAAGLVAFNFWEPMADTLDPMFAGTFLHGYEDALCLMLLFCVTLGLLRVATNYLSNRLLQLSPALQYGGAIFFGLIQGYLVSGFLICVLQTLPWHQNFMFFEYQYKPETPAAAVRRVMPPDRVWLALLRRAGAYTFANNEDRTPLNPDMFNDRFVREHLTFDKHATFELRYARYRRYDSNGTVQPYLGECDAELHKRR